MRKPLIVTLCMCTLKGACWDSQYKGSEQTMYYVLCILCLLTLLTWRSKHTMHWMLYLSIQSILVFAAFTQHCIQSIVIRCQKSTLICIQCPSPLQEGRLLYCLLSCGFSCSPVWGGSFVNFPGLVNYKGDCKQDTQPTPICLHWAVTKIKEISPNIKEPLIVKVCTQQPSKSYISMGTKLHPPYPNHDIQPVQNLDPKSVLQCLKNGSLWSCAGIGRFSLWYNSLIRAKRLANLADLVLNARVPTVPNSLLSNCSFLSAILSANELNSLWASSTVRWLTGTDIITINRSNFNVICNINTGNTGQKEACLYSVKFESQLTMKLGKKPPKWVIVSSRTGVGKDQRVS